MVKGRRAADRRREREGDDDAGDGDDTKSAFDADGMPAAVPAASPHEDYEEIEASVAVRGPVSAADSDVEEVDPPSKSSSRPRPAEPRRVAHVIDDTPVDAEKSFAREMKRKPREDTRAREGLEVTEVKEQKQRKPKAGGRFVVVSTQPEGSQSALQPRELTIAVYPCLMGRTATADLVLDDPSISLRHAEIGFDDGAFSLADLGSSSGTLRNGVVVDGRVPLAIGDIVQLGRTELRFFSADAVPQPRPEPEPEPEPVLEGTERLPDRPPAAKERTSTQVRVQRESAAQEAARRRREVRRKAVLVIASCVGVFLAVVVVRFAWQTAFSDAAPAQIRLQVSALLGEAKEKLLQGDVDGAAARVGTVLALDKDNDEAKSLDRTVATELGSRDALQLALRLGDEDRDDEALAALARIADSSVFVRDRDRLKTSLAERALVRSLRAVESLLDQGRVPDALARAEAHVKRFPDDEGGQALLLRVQQAKSAQPKDPALFPARAAFAEGRIDEARSIAAAAGYPGYVAELDRFKKSLDDGKALLSRFDGSGARQPLDEAFRLLGSLGARASSPIFATVQKPYADALYLSGTEKFEAGDLCGAARDLFKAARVVPDDGRVQIELQKLSSRAEQGLLKAQGARSSDRDRARAIAGEHLCLAKSGTKVYDELYELSR
ncbi:MAG: FHA domain-containing protein [Deltaproteobacteria bacterium]|nr:FHA domain-containing protein [Deltaproteobacteria bacterium]